MGSASELYGRAMFNASTVQTSNMYGYTRLKTNNEAGGLSYMENLQDVTLRNKNLTDRMKRKIVYRRDERVKQNIAFNSIT